MPRYHIEFEHAARHAIRVSVLKEIEEGAEHCCFYDFNTTDEDYVEDVADIITSLCDDIGTIGAPWTAVLSEDMTDAERIAEVAKSCPKHRGVIYTRAQ